MKRKILVSSGQELDNEAQRFTVVAHLSLALVEIIRTLGRISPAALKATIKREVPGAYNTRTDEIEE